MFKSKKNIRKLPKAKTSKMDLSTKGIIFFTTTIVLLILAVLVLFIFYKSIPVFKEYSFFNFLFGSKWEPNRDGVKDASYGLGKIILSTLMIMFFTLLFAIPLTIFSSLFIAEYLKNKTKKFIVTIIQLLAGIPSVVFGLFAINQIGPIFISMGAPSGGNMMTASFTLTFMALPTMITLSINAIEAVPEGHRYASLGLGMTKEKTTFGVVLPFAMPKIITAIITGVARIIGETMAVILIAGNSTKGLNFDDGFVGFIFSSIRTLASTIGLEMLENHGSTHESALYAIGLVLFIIVIFINLIIIAVGNINKKKTKSIKKLKHHKTKKIIKSYEYDPHSLNILVKTYTEKRFAKKVSSFFLLMLMISSSAIIVGFTSWILLTVMVKGLKGFNFESFLIIEGQKSGIFALIFTTLLLVLATIIFAIPLALIVAIYLGEYAHAESKFAKVIRFSINVLASTPSIVFGVFGLSLFVVYMKIPMSVFASCLTMTIVILPSLITSFEDSITSVPPLYKEAAYGMGLTKTKVLFKVVIPNATKGIVTGTILAIARIIGESAPVYLTLGTSVRMPTEGFFSSGATLTTQIYMMASEGSDPKVIGVAYQISLITIILVLGLNFLSKYIGVKLSPTYKKIPLLIKFKLFISIFKWTNIKISFNKFKKNMISIFKKIAYTFSIKRMKIHINNHKTRNNVIKSIKKKAKENNYNNKNQVEEI